MVTVMAFGTFDLIHPGHLYYLKRAKAYGDKLVVVIAKDKTIQDVKGFTPKYNEKERVEHVRELPYVDQVVLGYDKDKYEIIEEVNPDIICLGYDQTTFTDNLQEKLKQRGLKSQVFRIGSYKEQLYKSSKLR